MSPTEQQMMLVSGKLISLSQAAKYTPYSAEYLNLLCRKGRLSAIKLNRDWFTTEAEVKKYLEKQAEKHQKKARFFHQMALGRQSVYASTVASSIVRSLSITKKIKQGGFAGLGILSALALGIISVSGFIIFSLSGGSIHKLADDFKQSAGQAAHNLSVAFFNGNNQQQTVSYVKSSPSRNPSAKNIGASNFQPQTRVLGESTIKGYPDLSSQIKKIIDEYIAQGKLVSPPAPTGKTLTSNTGLVDNGGGRSTAVVGGSPFLSYFPSAPGSNFTGGSVLGVTNLSGQNLSAGTANITQTTTNNLTVNGNTSLGTTTAGSLIVQGNTTLSGQVNLSTTTISNLVVTGANSSATFDNLTVNNAIYAGTPGNASSTQITTVDSSANVGEYNSIAMGPDGFARIAYVDNTNWNLKFAQCTNADCTTKNITVVDSSGNGVSGTSLAMGPDGFARIAYADVNDGYLKFVQCLNADCSSSKITTVDSSNNSLGAYNSMALDANGFARISYYDGNNNDLKYAQCTNADCSTANITTLDNSGDGGYGTSLALTPDGLAEIAYLDASDNLKLAQCNDAACSEPVFSTIGANLDGGSSIAIGSDGFVRIAYTAVVDSIDKVIFIQCNNTACSAPVSTTVIPGYNYFDSLSIASDGFARFTYEDTAGHLGFIQCTNADCSTFNTATIDSIANDGWDSLALGSDGLARIAYYDGNSATLKFARLETTDGQPKVTGTVLGTATAPFGSVTAASINSTGNVSFAAPQASLGVNVVSDGDFSANPASSTDYIADGDFTTNPETLGPELATDGGFTSNPSPTLGSEQTTDGNFNTDPSSNGWTLGSGWAYNSGSQTVDHTPGNTDSLIETGSLTDGDWYQVQFHVDGTVGNGAVWLGNNEDGSKDFGAGEGDVSFYTQWTSGSGNIIQFNISSLFNGAISNVSVKPITSGWALGDSWTWDNTNHQANYERTTSGIYVMSLVDGGSGYQAGDVVSVDGGYGGEVYIAGVNGSGTVTSIDPYAYGISGGDGYSSNQTYTTTGGHGSGFTVYVSVLNFSGQNHLNLPGSLQEGHTYQVSYNVGPGSGQIGSEFGGADVPTTISSNAGAGLVSFTAVWGSAYSDGSIIDFITSGSNFTGSITNVSVKEVFPLPWIFGPDWAWDSGGHQLTHTTGNSATLVQPGVLPSGQSYTAQLDVSGTAGNVQVCLGDSGTCQTFDAGTGTVSFSGNYGNSIANDSIIITPSLDFDGSVTNVSVQGSTGSWTLGDGWSWDSGGHMAVHDGSGSFDQNLLQPGTLQNGPTYQASFDVGGSTGTVTACLDGGTCQEFAADSGSVNFSGTWSDDVGDIINFEPSSDFNGTISNVVVKEIPPAGSRLISVAPVSTPNVNGTNLVIQAGGAGAGGANGVLQLADPGTGYKASLDLSQLSANHIFTFPNVDGTILATNTGNTPGDCAEWSGTAGVLTDAGAPCGSGGSSQWTATGNNIYFNTGNVGINVSNPSSVLEVVGNHPGDDLPVAVFKAEDCGIACAQPDPNTIIGLQNTNGNGQYAGLGFYDANASTTVSVENSAGVSAGIYGKFTDTTNHYGSLEFYTRQADGLNPRLTVRDNGSVGIGTTQPLGALQVEGGSIYADAPESDTVINGGAGSDWQKYANMVGSAGLWAIRTGTNGSINFDTNNDFSPITALTVLTGGNIGIGTSNPDYTLDVNGSIGNSSSGELDLQNGGGSVNTSYNTLDDGNGNMFVSGSLNTNYNTLDDGGGNMFISGDVGIGTTTPAFALDVNGTINAASYLQNGSPLTTSQWTSTSTNIYYTAGNVGIGTTSPEYTLDVNGDIGNSLGELDLQVDGGSVYTYNNMLDDGSGNMYVGGSLDTNYNTLDDGSGNMFVSGNVGIGTPSPSQALEVAGNIKISGLNNGLYFPDGSFLGTTIGTATTTGLTSPTDLSLAADSDLNGSGQITFSTNGNPRMTITNGGNVGIGTSSPGSALDVNGDINFTGNLYQNGSLFGGGGGSSLWTTSGSNVYDTTGNVAIGTSNFAGGQLEISQPDENSGDYPMQRWDYGSDYFGYNLQLVQHVGPGNVSWSFDQMNDGSSYPNTLTLNGGNVGIGTANPEYTLDVNGDIGNSSGSLGLQDQGGGSVYTYNNTLDDGSGNMYVGGSLSTNNNTLDDGSGNMYISGISQVYGHTAMGNLAGIDTVYSEDINNALFNTPDAVNSSVLNIAEENDSPPADLGGWGNNFGISSLLSIATSSPIQDSQIAGNFESVTSPGSAADYSNVILTAGNFEAAHYTAGNIGRIQGINVWGGNVGGASNVSTWAIDALASNGAGTGEDIEAANISASTFGGAQANFMAGLVVDSSVYDTSTVASNYGIQIQAPLGDRASTGVANNYGLYIQDQSGVGTSTSFNLYSAGSGLNYFAGKVGIGTTSPQYLLQVGNATIASGTVARFQNVNGTCDINPTNAGLQCSSDIRLKQNINSMASSSADILQDVLSLNPVYFNWNSEASGTPEHPGFIAQQVQQIFPDLVSTDSNGYEALSYSNFAPYLVGAIQAQEKTINNLQLTINNLQGSLTGNATSSDLIVYSPSNFSGDSVGEAEILAGATSTRVSFSTPYQYQPIITVTPLDFVVGAYRVTNVDASGFTIETQTSQAGNVTFDWHSFASPSAQLTVSDGSTSPVTLVLAQPQSQVVVNVNNGTNGSNGGNATTTPDSGTVLGASTTTPDITNSSSTPTFTPYQSSDSGTRQAPPDITSSSSTPTSTPPDLGNSTSATDTPSSTPPITPPADVASSTPPSDSGSSSTITNPPDPSTPAPATIPPVDNQTPPPSPPTSNPEPANTGTTTP